MLMIIGTETIRVPSPMMVSAPPNGRLAPAIPHAQHMHGHALMRSGRTQEAIVEFLRDRFDR